MSSTISLLPRRHTNEGGGIPSSYEEKEDDFDSMQKNTVEGDGNTGIANGTNNNFD